MADYCVLIWKPPDGDTIGRWAVVGHYSHLEEDAVAQYMRLKEEHGSKNVRLYVDLKTARDQDKLRDSLKEVKEMANDIRRKQASHN